MPKTKLPALTEKQTKQLEAIYPELSSIINALDPVVAEPLMKRLKAIQKTFSKAFDDRWQAEEDEDERAYEELTNIADENDFVTTWSITEVPPEDMDKPFSKKAVKSITYESWNNTQTINFEGKGKKITWLEAWKYADQIIRQSGDDHHNFIEDFTQVSPGHYELITGS